MATSASSVVLSCEKNLLSVSEPKLEEKSREKGSKATAKRIDRSSSENIGPNQTRTAVASSDHVESRSVVSNEFVSHYSSAIPNENQNSLLTLTKAISEVLKSSFSDIKETMESGFHDLGHQIQNQFNSYDSQSEEQDDIDIATGSKDQAEINNDCQLVSSNKKRKLNSGEAEDSGTETEQTKTRNVIDKLTNSLQLKGNTGPAINQELAQLVEKLMREKPSEDKLTELKKLYETPENCDSLTETKVNQGVWNNLDESARSMDLKFQKVQKCLVKGITSVVSIVDTLLLCEKPPDSETLVTRLMNGVLLFANANQELNLRRREMLRPQLNANYRYLCAPSNPVTGQLFGDDLPKAIKDIADTNRLSSKLNRTTPRYIRHGSRQHTYGVAGRGKYRNNSYNYTRSRPFQSGSSQAKNYHSSLHRKQKEGGKTKNN